MMYVQDYDEVMLRQNIGPGIPPYTGLNGVTVTNGYVLWPTLLHPYVKNTQVYNCPSNTFKWTGGYTGSSCYGYLSICSGQPLAMFNQPASTICMYDVKSQAGFTNQYAPGVGTAAQNYLDSGLSDIHSEGSNVLFVDGHVKWYKQNAALADRTLWQR